MKPPTVQRAKRDDYTFASGSLGRHLTKGVIGFGLAGISFWQFEQQHLVIAAVLGVGAMIALRGCPMCWTIGLVQLVSRGKWRKNCIDGSCRVYKQPENESGSSTMAA